jgi:hypothetical protein
MTQRVQFFLLNLLFATFSLLALEVKIESKQSEKINQSIFLQLSKFSDDNYVENPQIIIDQTLDSILAENGNILIGDESLIITDISAEANKKARELANSLYPALNKEKLQNQAKETFPIYREGDYIEFVYDPFRKIPVKGKIKRISREFLFVGFSGQYAIKNILDPALRDSFFPSKVEANRNKFVDTLMAKQRYQFNVALNKNVQPMADKLIAQNENNGFIYVVGKWSPINDIIASRVNDKSTQIKAEKAENEERMRAEEAARQAEAARLKAAAEAEAQKELEAKLAKQKADAENAKRIAELQGDELSDEDKALQQEELLKQLAEEEEKAAAAAAAKRKAKADLKKRKAAEEAARLAEEEANSVGALQLAAIAIIIILGVAVICFVLFRDKIKIGKKKRVTLDQITGVGPPPPSTMPLPNRDKTATEEPSLADQAAASRDTEDGAKIEKKTISFSKSKPGNSSNFFSPEEIENSETKDKPEIQNQASSGKSQAIAMSTSRPGSSSKTPLTPPGGGLTPPGGNLTPPGGGLTPPSSLTAPTKTKVEDEAEDDNGAASLITDPNLKPKPKLQLRSK